MNLFFSSLLEIMEINKVVHTYLQNWAHPPFIFTPISIEKTYLILFNYNND